MHVKKHIHAAGLMKALQNTWYYPSIFSSHNHVAGHIAACRVDRQIGPQHLALICKPRHPDLWTEIRNRRGQ
jgi:hypothetical protein